MQRIQHSKMYFIFIHIFLLILLCTSMYAYSPWIRTKVKEILEPADKVYTIAHRGASGYAPENTIPAFELAINMKTDYIELDIQLTKDRVPVVIHDETINRTTNGMGYVKNFTLEELSKLDAGTWFNEQYPMFARDQYAGLRIPTLEEVFERFGKDVDYMIEIKDPALNPNIETILNEQIEKYNLSDHVSIHSFSESSLRKLHSINPEIPLYQIVWYNIPVYKVPESFINRVKTYAVGISPNFQRINSSYVAQVKNSGLKVFPYTVNYQVNMDKAVVWGVDGVHTNFPDRFNEVIKNNKK
ncbi:glycerophosphodiester phosphodiesterase [Paenibacillus sp. G2S3]|uniref:glycerophosphodiester phosphodiesterase n=1 Tax=Paenibacillus sp. G2S3 TaxID=3047872 RepID=UPI0024C1DB72|nr:glycerophosphodiester phosphodiesterase [Paenibacillus sp. G2S3]WHY16802.1 glycerophosphodiester phosphodiesterase [Paenibacillus sp. G2S3]